MRYQVPPSQQGVAGTIRAFLAAQPAGRWRLRAHLLDVVRAAHPDLLHENSRRRGGKGARLTLLVYSTLQRMDRAGDIKLIGSTLIEIRRPDLIAYRGEHGGAHPPREV